MMTVALNNIFKVMNSLKTKKIQAFLFKYELCKYQQHQKLEKKTRPVHK